ncbi:MAG: SsrA-binding protein [Elusimicrobia bacterium]|nr:MAG: SsrA-binding protein [Elusimicrobiota bacterium]
MAKKKADPDKVLVASNRKARFHYEIFDIVEAGICLKGPEVKSLRDSKARLEGAFARLDGDELYLHSLYIAPYKQNTGEEIDPDRTRKLLVHRRQIAKFKKGVDQKGQTLVAIELYFHKGWAKVSVALAKGKNAGDKRANLKKKAQARELDRSFKGKFKL